MTDPGPKRTRAQEEAAEWLARLGNHSITTKTVSYTHLTLPTNREV